jgi:two-component system, OmpR family, sensor histidine kinase KdpD
MNSQVHILPLCVFCYLSNMEKFLERLRVSNATKYGSAVVLWWLALTLIFFLDGRVELGSLAFVLILASAFTGLLLPPIVSIAASAVAVAGFNWFFIPPRGTFSVSLDQHLLLLGATLVVSVIVAALMSQLRHTAINAQQQAIKANQLANLSIALRSVDDPIEKIDLLEKSLSLLTKAEVVCFGLKQEVPLTDELSAGHLTGYVSPIEMECLWVMVKQVPDSAQFVQKLDQRGATYLPMRGSSAIFGSVLIRSWVLPNDGPSAKIVALLKHCQAMCDQMGLALERREAMRHESVAREHAQAQTLRNTLLAAISHDYRTPLATIMSAASSIQQQYAKLSSDQITQFSSTIIAEAEQLNRITTNTLQLARLETREVKLQLDWESAEEIVGSVMQRLQHRENGERVVTQFEPALPLIRCDAVLIVQMLENLVDNALKYSPAASPVQIVVSKTSQSLVISVIDQGDGVPAEWRERIFNAFERGDIKASSVRIDTPLSMQASHRGVGIGLAVSRAVARVHGGDLTVADGVLVGSIFRCELPILDPVQA